MSDHKTTLAAYSTSIWTFLAGFFSTMTANDFALYVGIICTLGTFALNWYYKRKHFKLLEERTNTPFPVLQEEV